MRFNTRTYTEEQQLNSDYVRAAEGHPEVDVAAADSKQITLKDPRAVLSMLEADQVVAAKRRTRFGRQRLSLRTRVLLWCLRVYVVLMLVIVAISVVRALHPGH
jgi:hypothetical protein